MTENGFHMLLAGMPDPGMAMIVNGIVRARMLTEDQMCEAGIITQEHSSYGILARVTVAKGLGCSDRIRATDIVNACPKKDIGVVLYCIPIQDMKFEKIEKSVREGMRKITEAYKEEVWKKGVVVFLHAHSEDIDKDEYDKTLKTWKNRVYRNVNSFIKDKFFDKIGFVPTGFKDKPVLPDGSFWLSHLWSQVYHRGIKSCANRINSLANETRSWMSVSDMRKKSFEDIRTSEIWRQPICKDAKSLKTKVAVGLGVGGAAVGAVATGATVGALIGALAIGIPSFGVAAGAGLVLGGAIGGGIGAGVVGAAAGGATAYKKHKDEKEQDELIREQIYMGFEERDAEEEDYQMINMVPQPQTEGETDIERVSRAGSPRGDGARGEDEAMQYRPRPIPVPRRRQADQGPVRSVTSWCSIQTNELNDY